MNGARLSRTLLQSFAHRIVALTGTLIGTQDRIMAPLHLTRTLLTNAAVILAIAAKMLLNPLIAIGDPASVYRVMAPMTRALIVGDRSAAVKVRAMVMAMVVHIDDLPPMPVKAAEVKA
jgi:hypothetical protein